MHRKMADQTDTKERSYGDSSDNSKNHVQQDSLVQAPQDAHTREKLFDFIALLQGRRMDDQRATLKP